jgi:predicted phage-related endonuclease
MNIIRVEIGSEEWLRLRRLNPMASEAPIVMGVSPYVKRDELLHMKATGTDREFSDWFQRNVLDKGHEIEALARPMAELEIGEDIYPIMCIDNDDFLAATLDGYAMIANWHWENKQWSEPKAAHIREHGTVPECDYPQIVHQFAAAGTERALYTLTDGTPEKTLHVWVDRNEDDIARLKKAWQLFAQDLAAYEPPAPQVDVVGVSPETLPSLSVQVTGMVTASNLEQFRSHALAVIESINTDLQTDQDFVDAEKAVKWCKDVEDRLTATKAQVLGQMASIDEVCRAIDEISETTRQKRLMLDKLVKSQKDARRGQIVGEAKMAWQDYMKGVNAQFHSVRLDLPCPDFAAAIKGKKTLSSVQSACNDLLAQSKIAAMGKADLYRANLKTFVELAEHHGFLFRNLQALIDQPGQAFEAIVKTTIAEYEQQQKAKREAEMKRMEQEAIAKAEAEREKIRREEQAKAEAEQRRLAEEERAREQAKAKEEAEQRAKIEAAARAIPAEAKPTMLEAEATRMKAKVTTSNARVTYWQGAPPTVDELVGLIARHYNVEFALASQWFYSAANQLQGEIA